MDLTRARQATDVVADLRDAHGTNTAVVPRGSGTHWTVGGDLAVDGGGGALEVPALEIAAPQGVIDHDPADLTVRVSAGTSFRALKDALGAAGQECALDPREPEATVGGILATGLSGPRRLRLGPLRDRVLEVRFVSADGRLVKGGGPTVKNVSGYDIPRLMVGSLGTLGVFVEATLRCQPLPPTSVWLCGRSDPFDVRRRLFRPSCVAWDGSLVWVLMEGHSGDVAAAVEASGLSSADAPAWPAGPFRGRISVRPGSLRSVGPALAAIPELRWLAEIGVGTVHVASAAPEPLHRARAAAEVAGGWMLREAGEGLPGFGVALPNVVLSRRLKDAFDPDHRLNPGRLPW